MSQHLNMLKAIRLTNQTEDRIKWSSMSFCTCKIQYSLSALIYEADAMRVWLGQTVCRCCETIKRIKNFHQVDILNVFQFHYTRAGKFWLYQSTLPSCLFGLGFPFRQAIRGVQQGQSRLSHLANHQVLQYNFFEDVTDLANSQTSVQYS